MENWVGIPSVVSSFICESASSASSFLNGRWPSLSSIAQTAEHEMYKGLPIPASLVKEQWRLIFNFDANARDLEEAIAHCRDLVVTTEECSEERSWLVRHLIDLRYLLTEIQEAEAENMGEGKPLPPPIIKSVVGHHFLVNTHNNHLPEYCDYCTGIIWNVLQVTYKCGDCNYLVHQKCIENVTRICAHVIASEREYPIDTICPEIGLAAQRYKCAECKTEMHFKNSWFEPRICDYTGLYYCSSCHWNDNTIIPARVVHNWDFTPQKVSRASLQELRLLDGKPLINLEEVNPKLFVFLDKLSSVKKLRQNLVHMRKYLSECKDATESKLIEQQLGVRRRLVQSSEMYSLNDLVQTESGHLAEFLQKAFNIFSEHIRKCDRCTGKAYICEICSNCQVIFPFDDGCVNCEKCNSVYHRSCMSRKNNKCPKCKRIEERKLLAEHSINDNSNENLRRL